MFVLEVSQSECQKMSENVSITPKQEQIIALLLDGLTISEAAAKAKLNERTVYRWQKEAGFQQAFTEARKRLLDHSFTSLQLKFDKAVKTLDRHLDATKTIPRDQIKAAEVIVDKTIQIAKLTERIATLEAQLETLMQEQEQDRMYKVIFDFRDLTQEERADIDRIEAALTTRKNAK